MHEQSFLAGLELGKFLHRLQRLEDGQARLRQDLDGLTHGLKRMGLLAALWSIALIANISTDTAAELTVELVKRLVKG